jgi:glutaredoxin
MKKEIKLLILGLLSLLSLSYSIFILTNNMFKMKQVEKSTGNDIVLFYGETCPYCKVVERYIEDNNIEEKLRINKKEVYKNKDNLKELEKRAQDCNLSTSSIIIPFLWDGEKCYVGDEEITIFLKAKTK